MKGKEIQVQDFLDWTSRMCLGWVCFAKPRRVVGTGAADEAGHFKR